MLPKQKIKEKVLRRLLYLPFVKKNNGPPFSYSYVVSFIP